MAMNVISATKAERMTRRCHKRKERQGSNNVAGVEVALHVLLLSTLFTSFDGTAATPEICRGVSAAHLLHPPARAAAGSRSH